MSQPATPSESTPFEKLLAEARAGSAEALGQALQSCYPVLRNRAHRLLMPAALRAKLGDSDLVQTTFLEAQRNFAQFDGTTREELLAWLLGILTHNATDWRAQHFNTAKRLLRLEVPLDDERVGAVLKKSLVTKTPSPDAAAQAAEMKEALRKGMRELPANYARVIRLHILEELSFKDVAQRLGCSVDAARMLHCRAMRRLAESLRGLP